MHEECLKDTEGTVESGSLWRVLKIGWRVGIFLYLNNSEGHIQFYFILRVYPFLIKNFLRGIACLGTSDDQEWNSGQASF